MKQFPTNEYITAHKLRQLLDYDPDTGIFTWRVKIGRGRNVKNLGDMAGCINKSTGYWVITINGKQHRAHRLAWLYVHGVWPNVFIDHINSNRSDNRICNLREATVSENLQNLNSLSKNNTSGETGVSWRTNLGKWQAEVHINGKRKRLGYYERFEDAVDAARLGRLKHHPFTAVKCGMVVVL